MRVVVIKTVEQQDIQAVHRVRSGLMDERKAKANQPRGLASEDGLAAPKELLHLMSAITRWLEDQEHGLTDVFAGSCMGCGEI
jgi:transposase